MASQATDEDDAVPIEMDHGGKFVILRPQRKKKEKDCQFRRLPLHVRRPAMARQATHEDDAVPVEADHGGKLLREPKEIIKKNNFIGCHYMLGAPEWQGRPHMKMMLPLLRWIMEESL